MTTIYKDQDGKTIRVDKGTQPRSVVPVIFKSAAKRLQAEKQPDTATGSKPAKKEK